MHQVYRVSIVVPAYREERNVGILYKKIQEAMMSCSVKYNFNVFFVDDGSDDNTWDQITMICRKNI